ncbi:MAG: hypothetical protein PHN56_03605 [Candidatus Nanoarchaeia archaeon]|nr:hypothetical protein [Candidatus Nanoarchaeia archaeon]
MIDKKRIELFKEIYTNELQILTKLKDKKLINAAIVFENPSNKIDEILKYETLDDKDFKLINLKTKTAEFKNEMEKLSDISNNVNIGINKVYSDAKTKLSEIKESYLETIKLKEFLIKDSTEEKKKEAIKKIKDLAKKVNEFSKSMFEKYDEKETDYKNDKCIFSNEIRKTRYFFMLSQMLDKLKDKELIIIPNNIKKKNDNIKNLIKIYDNIKKDFVIEETIIKEDKTELNEEDVSKESLKMAAKAVDKIVNFMEKMKKFFKEMNNMRTDETIITITKN